MLESLKYIFNNSAFLGFTGVVFGAAVTLIVSFFNNKHAFRLKKFDFETGQRERMRLERRQTASDAQKLIMHLIRLIETYPPYQTANKKGLTALLSDWDSNGICRLEILSLIDEIYVKSFFFPNDSIQDDVNEIYNIVYSMMGSICQTSCYSTGIKQIHEISGRLIDSFGNCIRE